MDIFLLKPGSAKTEKSLAVPLPCMMLPGILLFSPGRCQRAIPLMDICWNSMLTTKFMHFPDMALSVKLGIVSAGATLGSVSFVSGKGDGVDIPDLASLKDVCDVSNDDDMTDYVSSMDFTKLMDNLTAAGVPDEVITYILSGGSSDTDTEIDDESIN